MIEGRKSAKKCMRKEDAKKEKEKWFWVKVQTNDPSLGEVLPALNHSDPPTPTCVKHKQWLRERGGTCSLPGVGVHTPRQWAMLMRCDQEEGVIEQTDDPLIRGCKHKRRASSFRSVSSSGRVAFGCRV